MKATRPRTPLSRPEAAPKGKASAPPPARPDGAVGNFGRFNKLVDEWLPHLTFGQVRALLVFMRHSDLRGASYPSSETIAKKTGLDVRNAQRAIAELQRLGWLVTESPGGGRNRSAVRRVTVPETPAPAAVVSKVKKPRRPHPQNPGAGAPKPRRPHPETTAPGPGGTEQLTEQLTEQQQQQAGNAAAAAFDLDEERELTEEEAARDEDERRKAEVIDYLTRAKIGEPTRSMLLNEMPWLSVEILAEVHRENMGPNGREGAFIQAIRGDAEAVAQKQRCQRLHKLMQQFEQEKAAENERHRSAEEKRQRDQQAERLEAQLLEAINRETAAALSRFHASADVQRQVESMNGEAAELAGRRLRIILGHTIPAVEALDGTALKVWAVEQQAADAERAALAEQQRVEAEAKRAVAEDRERAAQAERKAARQAAEDKTAAKLKALHEWRASFTEQKWDAQVECFKRRFPAPWRALYAHASPTVKIQAIREAIDNGQIELVEA
jgi:hypothetical protein